MRNWTIIVRAFSVLALTAFVGCQAVSLETQQVAHEVGFYAGGGQTRTIMQSNGLSTSWQSGDQLAVWAKNSAGEFSFANQIFKAYGIDGSRGFFTATLNSVMADDTYTYYCCYPAPKAVNGTEVSFDLPAVQDGKVTGGADIMIAEPVQYGPLAALPEPENHTNMRMSMNRMMHQFRFYIPSDNEVIGDAELERIILNFPSGVVGTVTLDVADKTVAPVLTDEVADIQINLAEKLGISGEEPEYACVAIAPKQFEEGDMLELKAYTEDQIAFFDPIDLCARNFEGGHSTPVRLNVKEMVDYAGIITFTLASNNLGENPNVITLEAPAGCNFGDAGSNVYVYNPGRAIEVGETLTFKFETDEAAYTAFSGQQITVTYDSDNAIVTETLTMPTITQTGKTYASLNVPYLLFEDFSCVYAEGESYGNNSYSQSERDQPGSLLDGYMSHTGWNAARFWVKDGAVRINTRYQCVKVIMSFASTHYGRLDTPALSAIKSGRQVNLSVSFDAGGYKHTSSSIEISNMKLSVATHTNSGKVDGIPTGATGITSKYDTTVEDIGTTYDSVNIPNDSGDNAFGNIFPSYSASVLGAGSATRICFYPDYTVASGTGNAEFNVYIDNIKVKIVK